MSRRHMADAVAGTTAQLAELIMRSQQVGEGFRIPLLRAAADGSLALVITTRGGIVPSRILNSSRPTAIVLADDTPAAIGPQAWPQAQRLLRWAKHVVLHATGGQPEHYALIAAATLAQGRVLVIEMEARRHPAWLAEVGRHLPRLRVLSIMPPNGGSHPVAGLPAGAVMQ